MSWTITGTTDDGTNVRIGTLYERWESAKAQLEELREVGVANDFDRLELREVA